MITTLLTDITVEDLCKGFVYDKNEGKGLFGWNGRLIIQPKYQRHYIYEAEQKDMDADHVAAWSRGGETTEANCEMLCKSHNRAKGNS